MKTLRLQEIKLLVHSTQLLKLNSFRAKADAKGHGVLHHYARGFVPHCL